MEDHGKDVWMEKGCKFMGTPHKHLRVGTEEEYCPYDPKNEFSDEGDE